MTDRTTRRPMELHRGDTITRHPDHPEQPVMWTVVSRRLIDGRVDICFTDGGGEHVISVDPVAELTVRPEPRMAVIHGLRQLATWLEANPDVPFREYESATVQHSVGCFTDGLDAQRAEVDRIAKAMGVEPADVNGHYQADKHFGPICYLAMSCQNDETAEGDAR